MGGAAGVAGPRPRPRLALRNSGAEYAAEVSECVAGRARPPAPGACDPRKTRLRYSTKFYGLM
ncbi:hypothetical protein EVAR_44976_1, partial [Eumeta japonica]